VRRWPRPHRELHAYAPDLDGLTQALVERTLVPIRQALRDAKLTPADLQGVVLVGGSTRLPNVRRAVRDFFGREPLTNLDPTKSWRSALPCRPTSWRVIARTATGCCSMFARFRWAWKPLADWSKKIIPRNSTLPSARAQEFTTFKDGQTAMSVHVVQGERDLVAHCRSLARFELRGIRPWFAGAARIRVTFQIDADGLLSVAAREQSSGVEAAVEVKPSYGLEDDEIARMLRDGFERADGDLRMRRLREARSRRAGSSTPQRRPWPRMAETLLTPPERTAIQERLYALADVLETGDDDSHDTLLEHTARLNEATQDFAARRMNASVQRVLAGRRLDDIGAAA